MKKVTRFIALSMVLCMLFSMTAFASNETSLDISDNGTVDEENIGEMRRNLSEYYNVASQSDDESTLAIAQAAADVIGRKTVTYTEANQVASLVQLGYSKVGSNGPISITRGQLRYKNWFWWKTEDVYLVCLSGTDTDAENQTTDWWTDLLSGFEFDNQYVRNIKATIRANVPAGSNLIITGHSLGGMVAQQVAADKDLKREYNFMNTVTFGSPLIDGLSREGMVKRLGDTSDVVPYLSVSTFLNIFWQAAGLNRENGGYSVWDLNFSAHRFSYQRGTVWGAYDPCGEKNAGRQLILNFATTEFYHSPVVVTD